ncbi:MAG: histidine phosphatase family protein [Mycobacteriales bacterium]
MTPPHDPGPGQPGRDVAGSGNSGSNDPGPGPRGDIVLLRHGETQWSRTGRHTGTSDVPLTKHGREQARALRPRLQARRFALVLTSPRQRARDTLRLAGGMPAQIDDDLAEWDYGDFEGLTTPQIRDRQPGWTIWSGDLPGGESARQVGARADRVLERVLPALEQGDVLICGHGHFGRVLTARYLGLPVAGGAHFMLAPATLSVLSQEHDVPAVRQWNVPAEPTGAFAQSRPANQSLPG